MNPIDAVAQLHNLSYSTTCEGGKLKLVYHGEGDPPNKKAAPLIEILKANRQEILSDPHFLIDLAIQEINRGYKSGTIEWAKKNRPQEWEKTLSLKAEINKIALQGNLKRLGEVLAEYEDLMLTLVREFILHKGMDRE